ncbi:acid-sensing ion channel 2-like [Saccostrea echinata]|uniref:acid-sensing ion channel 2-like n=1 Tax=Saccostrea echinata TaxID=191078 RepID=UPI002A7F9458|nr:acid-sensing ion channel 2-like [Saccostrea echinata]
MTSLERSEMTSLQPSDNSIRGLWRQFRDSSSLHGLSHISKERTFVRGIIWFILVIVMGISLTLTLYNLKLEYFSYPTLTILNIKMEEEITFPAVTVCNISPYKMSKLNPDEATMDYLERGSNIGSFVPPLNFSDPKYLPLYENGTEDWLVNISYSVSDMFIACKWKEMVYFDCTKLFTPYKTEWGLCFSFNGLDTREPRRTHYTGSILGLTMYLHINQSDYVFARNMGAGIKLVIHDHNEEPNIMNSGFLISPGFTTYMPLEMTKYKFLPHPFKAFGNEYCEDVDKAGFINNLNHHRLYSYSGCLRECKEKFAFQKCSCRSHHDLGQLEPICSIERDYHCHKPAREEFDGNLTLQIECGCPIPCSNIEYKTHISSAYFPANLYEDWIKATFGYTDIRENIMEVRIYYEILVYKSFEKIQKITYIEILGTIGGQMGVFLGASLLTLSELIEVLFLSIIVLCKKALRPARLAPSPAPGTSRKSPLSISNLGGYMGIFLGASILSLVELSQVILQAVKHTITVIIKRKKKADNPKDDIYVVME